jgi:hypothetical protein
LVRLGRPEEARPCGERLLALDPAFSIQRWAATVGIEPESRKRVSEVLRQAGLLE